MNLNLIIRKTMTEDVTVTKEEKEDMKYDFSNDMGDFKVIGMYASSKTGDEDKIITPDFKGFKLKFILSSVEIKLSREVKLDEPFVSQGTAKAILLTMKGENTLEDNIDYNGTLVTVTDTDTDTSVQINGDSGVFSSNEVVQTYYGKVKQAGIDVFSLGGDKMPTSFKLIVDPLDKLENGACAGKDILGGEQDIKFVEYQKLEE
ncbi:hypothetical protein POL82_27075 (plasmid) [Priestia aryabhattai]|uniref:hypothetical protein n=1 Tax=Priestia aryabhattai TaxID=412384 RepID=UPI00234E99BE|nr:hypothetical protein [Priestia aryabhattai]MDC7767148.1 hypothetical protein [Priestia aryabhattai]